MRAVIQRVSEAGVTIDGKLKASINQGYLILLGIEHEDGQEDIDYLVRKITHLRVFGDNEGKMNQSIMDLPSQETLVISQFTLHAQTKKGNRPSFIKAAPPSIAIPLYQEFVKSLSKSLNSEVKTGEFGADMKVNLVNDGPVTIIIDSKQRD